MSINYTNLVAQGRAKGIEQPWSPEELEALLLLERECNCSRPIAADYIRNGIMTVEDFERSQKVKFVPKTMGQAAKEAEDSLKESGKNAIATEVETTEEVVETEVQPEVEVEATSTGKKKTK